MPGERRISWVAQDEPAADGTPGRDPRARPRAAARRTSACWRCWCTRRCAARAGPGAGRLAARRVYQEGFQSIGVEVVGDTPAVAFYESLGFSREYVETRSVLDLAAVDWPALAEMATGVGAGYHLEFCPGGPPDDLIEAYARAKAEVRDVDDGELRPSSYDPQRLRDSLDTLHRAGHEAVHRARHPRADRRGGRADRGGGAGPAPDPGRPVRHDRGAGPPGLRHRPGDQGADAAGAALGRAGAGRGADLERPGQRGDAQGQRRAGLPARPGVVRVQRGRRRAGAPARPPADPATPATRWGRTSGIHQMRPPGDGRRTATHLNVR